MEQQLLERRRFYRLEAGLPITVLPMEKSESSLSAVARNISTGGLCVRINEQLKEKAFYLLKFQLPVDRTEKYLEVMGKVVWSTFQAEEKYNYKSGIEFVSLNDEARNIIDMYVQTRKPDLNRLN